MSPPGRPKNSRHTRGSTLISASAVSPDGKTVVVTSNQNGGYKNVALLDVASKQIKWITETQWDAHGGNFSPDGKTGAYSVNADGLTTTYLYNVASGKVACAIAAGHDDTRRQSQRLLA